MLSDGATSARAAASRANGSKSRGPKTAEGKARASQNALKHGLCARKFLLLPDDSRAQFAALEGALLDDLSPEGALQTLLAHRLIAAAWRLARADRLEFELFSNHDALDAGPGRALVRDGRDARVFPTLVRYRGAAQAELFRTLKALKSLQTEAGPRDVGNEAEVEETPRLALVPRPMPEGAARRLQPSEPALRAAPDEPEQYTLAQKRDTEATPNEPEQRASGHQKDRQATPNEPEPSAHDHPAPPANGHEGQWMVPPVPQGSKQREGADGSGGSADAPRGMCGGPERPGGSPFAILTAGPPGREKTRAEVQPPAVSVD